MWHWLLLKWSPRNGLLLCGMSGVLSEPHARSISHYHHIPFWNYSFSGTKLYVIYDVTEATRRHLVTPKNSDSLSSSPLKLADFKQLASFPIRTPNNFRLVTLVNDPRSWRSWCLRCFVLLVMLVTTGVRAREEATRRRPRCWRSGWWSLLHDPLRRFAASRLVRSHGTDLIARS